MREVWTRIEIALRAAPEQLAALATGATVEAIQAAEALLGISLPLDVRESYAVHNGSDEICILPCNLYGLNAVPLHSLDEMVREWQMWQVWSHGEILRGIVSPEASFKLDRYNPRWIPVTWDGGGTNLCIDLDPAPGGEVGQVICLDHLEPKCVVAKGWRAFLEQYALDLETGRLRFEDEELVATR